MTKPKKILTREEEADEIIRRLQTPPKKLPRTLTATWTIESLKDLSSQHGCDLEDEIAKALSASIAEEIDREFIECLKKSHNLFIPTYSGNHLVKVITLPSLIIMPCIYVPSLSLILK